MSIDEVKASEESAVTAENEETNIAKQVNEEAKTPVEAQGQPEESKPETLTAEKIAEMTAKAASDASEKALNSFQGKFANYTASQQKEFQEMIDLKLKPVLDWTDKLEQAQVEQLDPEQQVEYYKNKLEQKQETVQKTTQTNEPTEQQRFLADSTKQLIQDSGLNITEFDERIWKGWNQNMSPGQLVALATKNIGDIKASSQPKPQPQSQPQQEVAENTPPSVPPTTSGAPKGPGARVSTLSDLSQLMAEGKIDANQFRQAKNEISRQGYSSL